jgi:hypothetical protein
MKELGDPSKYGICDNTGCEQSHRDYANKSATHNTWGCFERVDKNCNNHYDGTVSKDIMFNIKGSKEAHCKL